LQGRSVFKNIRLSPGEGRGYKCQLRRDLRIHIIDTVSIMRIVDNGGAMNRREFIKILFVGGASALLNRSFSKKLPLLGKFRTLPEPQVNTFSSEIIFNSRESYHSGYSGALSDQILANVLWAVSKSPMVGSTRIIYVALPDNVYRYDPGLHDLIVHLSGNHMSEANLAFEVGVASDLSEDAGTALHYGHLAATSFWVDTSNQPSCCPKESARTNAANTWNPDATIQMVNCYGFMGTVSGITSECVAVSSDESLPDPSTDGPIVLENALADLHYGSQFIDTELSLDDISQLAWASYGNTPHMTTNGRAGITAASAIASYYLTGRIYIVRSVGVERYHMRLPSGQPTTRDHRIERVTDGDQRPGLRSAVPRIPQTAPNYFVYCAATASRYQLLEAGYCAAGALLQATSMGLQGYFTADFTAGERTAIINSLGIPSTDLPLVIFSGGQQLVGMGERESDSVVALAVFPNPFKDRAHIQYTLNSPVHVQLSIYDQSGRQVKKLVDTTQPKGKFAVTWNGTDTQGRRLPEGNYYSILKTGKNDYRQKLTKIT
jgi:hypothetical protein